MANMQGTEAIDMTRVASILPAVTPLALLALWLAFPAVTSQHCYDAPPTKNKGSTHAARERRQQGLHVKFHGILKNMNPKNTRKKSLIHENADANITCDFGDGDISRLRVAYLTHAIHTCIASSIILRWLQEGNQILSAINGIIQIQDSLYFKYKSIFDPVPVNIK